MKANFPDYWKVKNSLNKPISEIYVLQNEGDEYHFPELIEVNFQREQPITASISSGKNTKNGTEIYVLQSEGNIALFPEVLSVRFKNGKIVNIEAT